MSKWKCLNQEEEQMARERGLDPKGLVVNRIGQDYLVFLELKTSAETTVCLCDRSRRAAR